MRKLAIGLAAAFLVATVAAPVMATKPDPDHKYVICHRTASESNPWVIIEVDEASLDAHLGWPGSADQHPPKNGNNDILLGQGSRKDYTVADCTLCQPG